MYKNFLLKTETSWKLKIKEAKVGGRRYKWGLLAEDMATVGILALEATLKKMWLCG